MRYHEQSEVSKTRPLLMWHSGIARSSFDVDWCTYHSTADDATAPISARINDSPARLPHAVNSKVPIDRHAASRGSYRGADQAILPLFRIHDQGNTFGDKH